MICYFDALAACPSDVILLRRLYEQQLDGLVQTLDEGLARARTIVEELQEPLPGRNASPERSNSR